MTVTAPPPLVYIIGHPGGARSRVLAARQRPHRRRPPSPALPDAHRRRQLRQPGVRGRTAGASSRSITPAAAASRGSAATAPTTRTKASRSAPFEGARDSHGKGILHAQHHGERSRRPAAAIGEPVGELWPPALPARALGLRSFVPSRRDLGAALTDHADKGRDIDFAVDARSSSTSSRCSWSAGGRVGVAVHGPEAAVIPGSDDQASGAGAGRHGGDVVRAARGDLAGAATPGRDEAGIQRRHRPHARVSPSVRPERPGANRGRGAEDDARGGRSCRWMSRISRMAVGAIASTSGEGHIEVSGSATMSALANPLATAGPAAGGKPGREGQRDSHGRRPLAAERALRAPG